MKYNKKLFVSSLLLVTTATTYANECGKLNISILNKTGHVCELRRTNILNGEIVEGDAAQVIENGQVSPAFTMQQSYTAGPSVRLEYECDNKTITIVSRQGYCSVYAGNVSGNFFGSNYISADYVATLGSWWNSLPGEINWILN